MVQISRWTPLGPLVALFAVAGCDAADPPPPATDAQEAAVQGYEAPEGAPGFCTGLAETTQLARVPRALGTLVLEPESAQAVTQVRQAVAQLEPVLEQVWLADGYDSVGEGLEDLLADLHSATVDPVDEDLRARIVGHLDTVADRVQAICHFPT